MSPAIDVSDSRVRTVVGLSLALVSLGFVVWLTGRPAGAGHADADDAHAAPPESAPTSVVVSVLRSKPRLVDPGTPIPEAEWARARRTANVRVAPELGSTLIARTIPPTAELQLDSAPSSLEAPIGNVSHVEDGSLRVIDGWTNGTQDLQIELRLWPSEQDPPRAEAGAWDVRGNEAPSAWSDVRCDITTNRATWKDDERVVLRYRVTGTDALGKPREEGGLVSIVVP